MPRKQKPKPTIAELEAILDSPNPGEVTIMPNGTVKVKRTKPQAVLLTKGRDLGGTY